MTLPAASTLYGRMITFKDQYGAFSNSTLTLQTSGVDLFESDSSNLLLSNTYDYRTLIAATDNKWYTLASPYVLPSTISTNTAFTNTVYASTLIVADRSNQTTHTLFFSSSVLYDTTAPLTTQLTAKYQVFNL